MIEQHEIETAVVRVRARKRMTWDEWMTGKVHGRIWFWKPKPCHRCTEEFLPRGPTALFCDSCQIARLREGIVNKPYRLLMRLLNSDDEAIRDAAQEIRAARRKRWGGGRPNSGPTRRPNPKRYPFAFIDWPSKMAPAVRALVRHRMNGAGDELAAILLVEANRNRGCDRYAECLLGAGLQNWPSFTCRECAFAGQLPPSPARLTEDVGAVPVRSAA